MNAPHATVKTNVRAMSIEKPATWRAACANRAQKNTAAAPTVTESETPAA